MTYWRRCKCWCRLEDSHIAPLECSTEPAPPAPKASARPGDEAKWLRLAQAFRDMGAAPLSPKASAK